MPRGAAGCLRPGLATGPFPSRHVSRTRRLHILAAWTKRDIRVGKVVAEYAKLLRLPLAGPPHGCCLGTTVAARGESDQTGKDPSLSGPVTPSQCRNSVGCGCIGRSIAPRHQLTTMRPSGVAMATTIVTTIAAAPSTSVKTTLA